MLITTVIAGRSWEGVSKPNRASTAHFFLSLFGLALVLTLHTIHCKVTFTCVLSDPREKIRTIPWLQNSSPGHLLFLHWCKLFFLLCLSQQAFRAAFSPWFLFLTLESCQLRGCWEVANWLSRIVVLQFCAWKGLCAASAENSAGVLWGEHFLWTGGQMSPTSDTLLECLWRKYTLVEWLLLYFPVIYLGASLTSNK